MTHAVYLIGEPGAGKSTLMAALTQHLDMGPVETLDARWPLVKGRRWQNGVELGGTHEQFPGTDRLSMGVSPQAVQWVTHGQLPDVILAEGQRLSGKAFLRALVAGTDLTVIHLTVSQETGERRRARRGTDQNPTWVNGARTKASRAADVARDAGAVVIEIPTDGVPPEVLADIARGYTRT